MFNTSSRKSQLSSLYVWSMNSEIAGHVWLLHAPSVPQADLWGAHLSADSRLGKYTTHTHTHTHRLPVGHSQVQHQQNVLSTCPAVLPACSSSRCGSGISVCWSYTDTAYTLDKSHIQQYLALLNFDLKTHLKKTISWKDEFTQKWKFCWIYPHPQAIRDLEKCVKSSSDLEKCVIPSLSQQWMPSEWESKELIKTSQ